MKSTFYKKNLKILEQRYPSIYQKIQNLKPDPNIELFYEKTGEANLLFHHPDGTSQKFYRSETPKTNADTLVNDLKSQYKNSRILVFSGLGLAYHLFSFIKNPNPQTQLLVAFEASFHIFNYCLQLHDFSPLLNSNNIVFFIGTDELYIKRELSGYFRNASWIRYANAIEYAQLNTSVKIWEDFYSKIKSFFEHSINSSYERVFADCYDLFRGTRNVFRNYRLCLKTPGLSSLQNLFKDKPGIVVASGPSLKLNIPILKKLQNEAILIACPSALPLLQQEGISPHFCTNIERDQSLGLYFEQWGKQMDYFFLGLPLLDPINFQAHPNRNIYFCSSSFQASWFEFPEPVLQLGHSTAHAAFRILQTLGCSNIFLFGQDLAYSPDNRSHSQGVFEESVKYMQEGAGGDEKIPVEGNNGKQVLTAHLWNTFIREYVEDVFPSYSGKVYNVIPENYGAKLTGATRIDAEEALKLSCWKKEDYKKIITTHMKPLSEKRIEEEEKQFITKCVEAAKLLELYIEQLENYGLKLQKEILDPWSQFGEEQRKAIYQNFKTEFTRFMDRFVTNEQYKKYLIPYKQFFQPIMQGLELKVLVAYFSENKDDQGDEETMLTKVQNAYRYCETGSFWARQTLKVVEQFFKEIKSSN